MRSINLVLALVLVLVLVVFVSDASAYGPRVIYREVIIVQQPVVYVQPAYVPVRPVVRPVYRNYDYGGGYYAVSGGVFNNYNPSDFADQYSRPARVWQTGGISYNRPVGTFEQAGPYTARHGGVTYTGRVPDYDDRPYTVRPGGVWTTYSSGGRSRNGGGSGRGQ